MHLRHTQRRGLKKIGGTESCNFPTDRGDYENLYSPPLVDTNVKKMKKMHNIRQRNIQIILWLFKISNLSLNFHKMRRFQRKFSIFGRKFSDKKSVFRQFSHSLKSGGGQLLSAPMP